MDQAAESHEPIVISGKRHSAVLISAEDWAAIQETLFLLSVPGMRESIKAGMAEPVESCSAEARSEEHTSELQSLMRISYAVFCLKKKNHTRSTQNKLIKSDNNI